MNKVLFVLVVLSLAVCSCKPGPEEWEKMFSGSWLLSGSAELNWHSVEDMTNAELADVINSRLSLSDMTSTLEFGNGNIRFTVEGESLPLGSYVIDKDGIVSVSWQDGGGDTYWMYAQDANLYMIESDLDDFGEVSGVQTAYKFTRMTSVPFRN